MNDITMAAFQDELRKISGVQVKEATGESKSPKHLGKALLVGGGIAAWEGGKQALKDYQMGRAYRREMERQQQQSQQRR